ncbi:uncharacterized protein TM35_000201440 [Trypanosoma theileri]|uniref:Uncharacterized protein n=1 Tax=Trypanosoma theileri TaxID=67003 RepID=A0A1X0NSP1_9TRYP|nr:uncharacterized protein TM35_000201440 [Trypanosoma theileri]ORC87735.1 hypothetical protein TM35_000201440 [Trypanosoma theileri]
MPLVLRLCLHTVGSDGTKTQVWLSFSVLQTTTPRDIIAHARRSVVERMGAALDVSISYQTELALCVRDAGDHFLFLGTAAMEAAAQTPMMKMSFVQAFLRQFNERRVTSPDPAEAVRDLFVFLEGALVPLEDLKRLNRRFSKTEAKDFTMYEMVEVTPELSRDPVTAESSSWRNRGLTGVGSKSKPSIASGSGNDFINRLNDYTAFAEFNSLPYLPLGNSTGSYKAGTNYLQVVYVDFDGCQYTTNVPLTETQSLSSLISAACNGIGPQVGCSFQPSNMRIVCNLSNATTHTLESDAALNAALKDDRSRFYLAADTRLLESPLRVNPENSLSAPSLMLKETHDDESVLRNEPVSVLAPIVPVDSVTPAVTAPVPTSTAPTSIAATAAVASNKETAEIKNNLPWTLATTTVTLRQLASLRPTPSFSARDRQSILRKRKGFGSSSMSEEEDNARLRLAAAHFHLDEVCRQYLTASRESESDAVCNELRKRKAVLTEEWIECVSAERDCERLELLLAWLERDVADGHTRQENLIRTLYAAH